MFSSTVDGRPCPLDLQEAIQEFFPEAEWQHAVDVANLESNFNPDACNATALYRGGCGEFIEPIEGTRVTAEFSVGYFQINVCNLPGWNIAALFRARDNVGTAHHMWSTRGWTPWWFSARRLGLI